MSTPQITWKCTVCNHIHIGIDPPGVCPVCGVGAQLFERQETPADLAIPVVDTEDYLAAWKRDKDELEPNFGQMQQLATTGKSDVRAMGTHLPMVGWDSILFHGAQLDRIPLEKNDHVKIEAVIGRAAKKPLVLALPFYVSHMSFGALSREAKIALARGSAAVGTAIGSGEGGLLQEERDHARHYIYELGTAGFSHCEEAIRVADAVEIKIGQAAKPGMGGQLSGDKVTAEIARVRGIEPGEESISPSRQPGINTPEDLRKKISYLRILTEGRPVGVKITAGRIEKDLAFALLAEPDFVTVDCRGGGTGAGAVFIKDNVCLPPVYAIRRARRFLDKQKSNVTLCVTGGFRNSSDIAKAIAIGADVVALATASLIAIGCQQYRLCHTGNCPVGIATQDPQLRKRLDIDKSVKRFVQFYRGTAEELKTLARINGRNTLHDLDLTDVFTTSSDIAQYSDIPHAWGGDGKNGF